MKNGTTSDQAEARNILRAAIALLTQPNDLQYAIKARELCLAQGQLADVQMNRNALHSARSALNQAFAHLRQLVGEDIRGWLTDIDSRLMRAERDRDQDHEKDEERTDDGLTSKPPEPPGCAAEAKGDG
jgi:plasmid stability protein